MTAAYAANQTSKLPSEITAGEFVYSGDRWAQVDHVDVEGGEALIHLAPIRCAVDEPIAVCETS